jgi:voltage-gated potassium channel
MLDDLQKRTHILLQPAQFGDAKSRSVDNALHLLVFLNLIAVTLDSVNSIRESYGYFFDIFELISVAIFTLDLFVRIWTAPLEYSNKDETNFRSRIRYLLSFGGIIDVVSILPFYLQAIFPGADLRVLRALRLFRVLKLSTYNSALNDLMQAILEERKSFYAAVYIFLVVFVIASSLIYYAEHKVHPNGFQSIPDAMYWALITLTTVGYGDVTPVTAMGKIIAALAAISGVVVMALLTGIVATAFSAHMDQKKQFFEAQVREALRDGKIDRDEHKFLDELRRHFGMSKKQAEKLIRDVERRS